MKGDSKTGVKTRERSRNQKETQTPKEKKEQDLNINLISYSKELLTDLVENELKSK